MRAKIYIMSRMQQNIHFDACALNFLFGRPAQKILFNILENNQYLSSYLFEKSTNRFDLLISINLLFINLF